MSKHLLTTLSVLALSSAIAGYAAPASATTLTFDTYTSGTGLYTISNQGFVFGSGVIDAVAGPLKNKNVAFSAEFTMKEANGGTFSLQDFYVKAFSASKPDSVTMYGYLSGKQVSSVAFNETNVWQDITANFDLVDSITFSSIGKSSTYLELDNITVNAATTVPEPASMALLGVGLLGTGMMARRRRQCTTTAC